MTVERALRLIAGSFVTLSVLLGIYVNANFLWFTLFVGLNLFQSGFSNWCPMMVILRKVGLREGAAGNEGGAQEESAGDSAERQSALEAERCFERERGMRNHGHLSVPKDPWRETRRVPVPPGVSRGAVASSPNSPGAPASRFRLTWRTNARSLPAPRLGSIKRLGP